MRTCEELVSQHELASRISLTFKECDCYYVLVAYFGQISAMSVREGKAESGRICKIGDL